MNYIWEILLRARAQGLSDNELFFAQAEDCSPWYEQSFPCLNEDTVTGPVVEINSLYRFSEIFQDLLHNMGDSEYLRHLFDAAVHILAAQETLSGLSKRDFYVQMLKRELEGGGFSASIAQALQLLSEEQKRGVASLLLAQYETGSSLLVFRQALTALYPQAISSRTRNSFCSISAWPTRTAGSCRCWRTCSSPCSIRCGFSGQSTSASGMWTPPWYLMK